MRRLTSAGFAAALAVATLGTLPQRPDVRVHGDVAGSARTLSYDARPHPPGCRCSPPRRMITTKRVVPHG